jgi:hypothetical protein
MKKNDRNALLVLFFLLAALAIAGLSIAAPQKLIDYSPKPIPMGRSPVCQITGSNFQDKLTLTLEDPNGKSFNAKSAVNSPTELNATADLKVPGSLKAVIKNRDGHASASPRPPRARSTYKRTIAIVEGEREKGGTAWQSGLPLA